MADIAKPNASVAQPAEGTFDSLLLNANPARSVTRKSVLAGTVCVALVCSLTPYNDFVFSDTSLSAGFLPLSAVLILFALVVVINAPLRRWAPTRAFESGELAIVLLMTLMACSVTNWGLIRFFIPTPVAPFHLGSSDEQFWRAFVKLDLPKWLFPVSSVEKGRTDPVATWFYTHVPRGEKTPYAAWLMPLAVWGIFAMAMLGTLVAIARLVLPQWATNERLPYPLVQVQSALVQSPKPGFALNELFRDPLLWLGVCGTFAVLIFTCLNAYFPRHVPAIPLKYDLTGVLSEEPFVYLRTKLKKAMLSFTVVGVTYFIRSRAAFSLWATFIVVNLVEVQQGMRQGEIPPGAWADQHLGASIAFLLGILWIGRRHWKQVLRGAFGRGDVSQRRTFWAACIGIAIMLGWLCVMGVQIGMAILIVSFIIAAHLVVARVIAETGLPFYRSGIGVGQVYSNCPPRWFGGRDIFFACIYTVLGPLTTRDSVATFTQQGLGVCENAAPSKGGSGRLGAVIAWSLLFGTIVAAATTLHCQYTYATPGSTEEKPQRNYFGAEYIPKRDVANSFVSFSRGQFPPPAHNPAVHMATGLGITALLEIASLRWAAWPFLPVGYVASHGAFIENAWFSIFVGWLAQLLIVRFGGAGLFQKFKPLFIGIIFGEALAAGAWLLLNAILVMNGFESQPVKFLL